MLPFSTTLISLDGIVGKRKILESMPQLFGIARVTETSTAYGDSRDESCNLRLLTDAQEGFYAAIGVPERSIAQKYRITWMGSVI